MAMRHNILGGACVQAQAPFPSCLNRRAHCLLLDVSDSHFYMPHALMLHALKATIVRPPVP